MVQTNILSDRNRLAGTTCSKTASDYLVKFESALGYCIRAWSKYQPNDSLSNDRKQDLNWLQSKLRDYRLRIHSLSNCLEFWKGWQDGKHNRRTLPDKQLKSLAPILLEAFANTKADQIYELGFQVGCGIELTKRFKEYVKTPRIPSLDNQPKVLILTMQDNEESVLAAFAAGADSYCMKNVRFEKLVDAIVETHSGANWIDSSIAQIVLTRLNNPFNEAATAAVSTVSINGLKPEDSELLTTNPLTQREREVIELIVDGCSNEEIAKELYLSLGTVKTHVRNILHKLACDDRTSAAVRALRAGLVD